MIKVGCCGFPVARAAYWDRFHTVEVNSTFYALPRLSTVQKWREEAPEGAEFALKAWQLFTHTASSPTYAKLRPRFDARRASRCGHFRGTDEMAEAWPRFEAVVKVLAPRFILFQTPASFYPGADHLRDMYRFFKGIRRLAVLVWEPRGSWNDRLVRKVCGDLGLVHAVDPIQRASQHGTVRYFRCHGRIEGRRILYGHQYTDEELKAVLESCAGSKPAYVYFNNHLMWRDAQRFDQPSLRSAR